MSDEILSATRYAKKKKKSHPGNPSSEEPSCGSAGAGLNNSPDAFASAQPAVERVKEYADTAKEAPWTVEGSSLPPDWPQRGTIEFQDYGLQYRKGLDLALKGITLSIQEREKVRSPPGVKVREKVHPLSFRCQRIVSCCVPQCVCRMTLEPPAECTDLCVNL
ncbi:unnamed protein product [Boreogadus saida]